MGGCIERIWLGRALDAINLYLRLKLVFYFALVFYSNQASATLRYTL